MADRGIGDVVELADGGGYLVTIVDNEANRMWSKYVADRCGAFKAARDGLADEKGNTAVIFRVDPWFLMDRDLNTVDLRDRSVNGDEEAES